MSADIVIRGGTVVDGSGAPGIEADVAIEGGAIRAIGKGLDGARELDARGKVVAPGFIDIHTHFDAQVFWDPQLTPSCFHGVTTVVAGNCGFSIAPTRPEHRTTIARTLENVEDMDVAALDAGIPWEFETFPEYLASVERRGTVLNYAAYIGHTALRLFAMGDAAYERAAKDDEIERMAAIVTEAVRAGAAGFATSFAPTHVGMDGKPVPSRFAERREFEALCAAVAAAGRGVVAVAPGENVSIPDLYELQPKVGRPFTYGALLTFPGDGYKQLVALNDAGHAKGASVWPQVSPRPLQFQLTLDDPFTFNIAEAFAALMRGTRDARVAAYRDRAFRERALAQLDAHVMRPRWHTFVVAESPTQPALEGRRVEDVARERGTSVFDAILDIGLADDLGTRFNAVLANDDTEGVAWLLTREGVTLGLSDAGAHVGQLCDAPQATDLLGNWVRDRGVMSVEDAVRRLSGRQADIFGFAERGYLRPGYRADVVVFDPATVAPGPIRRVRDFPGDSARLTADQPTGMAHVLVNGTPIQVDGKVEAEGVAARPGMRPAIA
ncbi:MAG: amidohydrolase family protein [Myxococcales bacterium]|nr:amidohydrolase family protein [Myxococcales bacterium]